MSTFVERIPAKYVRLIDEYRGAADRRDWQTCELIGRELDDVLGPNWLHRRFEVDEEP